jgi:ribosome-binding protein aMBF1 (putative translation factor)
VEQSTIKRIELVQLAPTLDLLISLSRALGLHVRELVDDPAITTADQEL